MNDSGRGFFHHLDLTFAKNILQREFRAWLHVEHLEKAVWGVKSRIDEPAQFAVDLRSFCGKEQLRQFFLLPRSPLKREPSQKGIGLRVRFIERSLIKKPKIRPGSFKRFLASQLPRKLDQEVTGFPIESSYAIITEIRGPDKCGAAALLVFLSTVAWTGIVSADGAHGGMVLLLVLKVDCNGSRR